MKESLRKKFGIMARYALCGIILPLVLSTSTFAQSPVSGRVTDDNNDPLPGVSVVVKGTATGTSTDTGGNFTLRANPTDVLVFSFVGFLSKEVTVGNQSVLNVKLVVNSQSLDEVVVVGYGTQKRSDLTGSIASLKEEAFNRGVINSPEQLLQGKLAGVTVMASSGAPGAASNMTIRGPGTVRTGSGPLFVVDGVALDNASPTLGGAH